MAAAVLVFLAGAARHSPLAHSQALSPAPALAGGIIGTEALPVPQIESFSAEAESAESLPPTRLRAYESWQPFSDRHFTRDLAAMRLYRPGYEFWQHVFAVPNGHMAFGSAVDGRLLVTFPRDGNWADDAQWAEASLADLLRDRRLSRRLSRRADETAMLLDGVVGPVVYNATRGTFIAEGAERFGTFLEEWGAIFERFGVPADIGLAQALVESGFRGRIRSEAEAVGFCQWLPRNWARLQQSSPFVIEASNQTTQAPYCAAHLAILATKYGSLIPALSEHHAGSVNVGRTIINGNFAGGGDVRERYFLGAELTLLVRQARPPGYREVAGTYGPRSFRYAEMVFGNLATIERLKTSLPQERVFAMRTDRSLPIDEVASRTGLSIDEIRRFNPALINQVPASANLYLPFRIDDFGEDSAFWHRPATPEYLAVLDEFLRLDERFDAEDWHAGSALTALRAFEHRFRETQTEEGIVMASVLAYVTEELSDGRQREILARARDSNRAQRILGQSIDRMRLFVPALDDGRGLARQSLVLANTALR